MKFRNNKKRSKIRTRWISVSAGGGMGFRRSYCVVNQYGERVDRPVETGYEDFLTWEGSVEMKNGDFLFTMYEHSGIAEYSMETLKRGKRIPIGGICVYTSDWDGTPFADFAEAADAVGMLNAFINFTGGEDGWFITYLRWEMNR